jgi:hypothetical protein
MERCHCELGRAQALQSILDFGLQLDAPLNIRNDIEGPRHGADAGDEDPHTCDLGSSLRRRTRTRGGRWARPGYRRPGWRLETPGLLVNDVRTFFRSFR